VKHGSEKEEPSPSVLQPLSESAPSTSAQPVFWNDDDIKFLFKGTCFSIIAGLIIMIFCFLQRRYQCLPPPLS
jgi:hypothetical protein